MKHLTGMMNPKNASFGLIALCITAAALLLASSAIAGESIQNRQIGYSAYFPDQKEGVSEKLPILVTLPGYGLTSEHDINTWGFSAEKRGMAVVSVDMNYDRLTRIGDAERRIEAVLQDLARSKSIDPDRVVIAGTALGGVFAINLGLHYPERYKAVAVAGGGSLKSLDWAGITNARKQSFFLIHGSQSKYIPLTEFNALVKNLKDYGAQVKSQIFPDADESLPAHAYDQLISDLNTVLTNTPQ